jgi:hypothetical protein
MHIQISWSLREGLDRLEREELLSYESSFFLFLPAKGVAQAHKGRIAPFFILNHSPASNNLFAIFIEKKRLKWYNPTGI